MAERYLTEKLKAHPSQSIDMMEMAKNPIFPICILKLKKKTKPGVNVVEVEVGSALYDFLFKVYGTDDIILYCDLRAASIGSFSPDMRIAYDILQKLRLVTKPENWVKRAEPYIEKAIKRRGS
jgi:hypothetical protein